MSRACFISLSLVFLLIAYSQQLGVLYVNNIIGNSDFANVYVEDSIFNDNSLLTTYINGLVDCALEPPRTPCGVYAELVNYYDGNVDVPVNLYVALNTTIEGTLFPNGGIRSDSFPSDGYSFLVEDDTGNTGMIGELRLYGGLTADGGVFTVADGTGETTISTALLKPDGGINVQDGQFTVAKEDGTFFTSNFANVEGDFYLGTSISEDRYITRFPASTSYGGATVLLGQTAANVGGDIILEPGVGQDSEVGSIILGRAANDNLYFGRPAVDVTGTDGGTTYFLGQSTDFGNGGDLVFSSGDSSSAGNGGDIVLDVGSSTGVHGQIILGNTDFPNHNLLVTRPAITSGPGGSTYVSGQSTSDGVAGDLYLRAGAVNSAAGALISGTPGNVILSPGVNNLGVQGSIYLGRSSPVNLIVRRYPIITTVNAGRTIFKALDVSGTTAKGGDLYLQAGNGGNAGNGGDLHFQLGDLPSYAGGPTPGQIYWGIDNQQAVINVKRAPSQGSGAPTNVIGQESLSGNGGALRLIGGSGSTNAGDLSLTAGTGTLSDGGSVTFTAGDGTSTGGSISFNAGSGTGGSGTGGNVNIQAGTGSSLGGSIYLNAGSGNGLGDVIISSARQFNINTLAVNLQDYLQIFRQNGDSIVFQANPESILSFSGDTLIKDRIYNVQVTANTDLIAPIQQPGYYTFPIIDRIQNIIDTTQDVINAISQCGHGLFTTVDNSGNAAYCNLPGPVPTPIARP